MRGASLRIRQGFFMLAFLSSVGTTALRGEKEGRVGAERETEQGLELSFELRPSWGTESDSFHSDNDIEIGYRFSRGFELEYTQRFELNFRNPSGRREFRVEPCISFASAKFDDLWTSRDAATSFSLEARAYAPVDADERGAGQITGLRSLL